MPTVESNYWKKLTQLAICIGLCVPIVAFSAPPTTPRGFRSLVYSSTAAELFWERSSAEQWVVGYELKRDGESLGILDVLSYFDDTLVPGISYEFSIAVVDSEGERSDISTIMVRTPLTLHDRVAMLEQEIIDLREQLDRQIPSPVPETGQTVSYQPGDDGDWQVGVTAPEPRFTVNANEEDDTNDNGRCDVDESCNGTVTDNLTGLVWLREADCFGAVNWFDAITLVNQLAANSDVHCGLTDNSLVGDWRLPNVREMISMVDFSLLPTVPTGHPMENLVTFEEEGFPGRYWASTALSNDDGYTVSFAVAWVERWIGTAQFHVWAVR